MTLKANALTKVHGNAVDTPLDPVFTNSDISGDYGAGLLMDLDFADPDGAGGYEGNWPTGDKLINSAWEHVARRLIPTATKDSLSSIIANSAAENQIVVQRTSKGYPHVIVSKVNDATNALLSFSVPADILTYILVHPTHIYRAAIEERITRADEFTGNSGNTESGIWVTSSSTAQFLYRMEGLNSATAGFRPTTANGTRLGTDARPDIGSTEGERYKSIAVSAFTGTLPANIALLTARAMLWGPAIAGGVHLARSSIARRFILEDLTVSEAVAAAAIAAGSPSVETHFFPDQNSRHQAIWNMRKASADYYLGDVFNDPDSVLP